MKCVILLKSEYLNVPLSSDLVVEFNSLKPTSEPAPQGPFTLGFFWSLQSHYVLIYMKGTWEKRGNTF